MKFYIKIRLKENIQTSVSFLLFEITGHSFKINFTTLITQTIQYMGFCTQFIVILSHYPLLSYSVYY
jgi:hypothetical protein